MAKQAKQDAMMTTLSTESMEQRFRRLQKEAKDYAKEIGLADFDKTEYDPLIELAKIAINPGNKLETRLSAHSEIASYRYPKLRSMEVALPPGSEGRITIEITHFGGKKVEKVVEADYTRLPPQ
jgi:hypothetical protein